MRKSYAAAFISMILFLTGCTSLFHREPPTPSFTPQAKTAYIMGTLVRITILDEIQDAQVFQQAFDRIAEIEERMTINTYSDQSEIIRLNNAAGHRYSELSADTFFVLEKGRYYSELSEGRFDITIGPLVKLWNIGTDKANLPEESEIREKMQYVNYTDLVLDKEKRRAKLNKAGMMVDLGGIAKGYAADEAGRVLGDLGIRHAIVNLGGNIVVLNARPNGTDWRIGLQDPFEPRGAYMGVVMLNNQTLVSSGTYESFFEEDGIIYHHIINPQTGYPEQNNVASVAIITQESIAADGLSTTIFLLGLEEGMKMIESIADAEAIFITDDKQVFVSSGVNDQNFQIINNEYVLQK